MSDPEVERLLQRKLQELTRRQATTEATNAEIVELGAGNFDNVLRQGRPVLVDFWAEWCGPCHVMEPVVERIARKYAGKLVVGKLNVDANSDIATRFRVFSIPTFIVFRDGRPIDSAIGAVGEAGLERLLGRHID